MKNPISFVAVLLVCLSICLSSCAEKGSGCYYSEHERIDSDQKPHFKTTLVVQKEISATAE